MRQVPHYLIIGRGRVARHFQHYFSLLGLVHQQWHRDESFTVLQARAQHATHILLLINDQAIDAFIEEHLLQTSAVRIHCSGSLVSQFAYGAHPLMSFNHTLYDLPQYQSIPFMIDEQAPAFAELLPGLSNQHARLAAQDKAKYHALCVMSGNFSCLLWQKLFATFEKEFNLPRELAFPYLKQQTANLMHDAESALTGPLVRNDQETITANLLALEQDTFQQVYRSFVECFQENVALSSSVIASVENVARTKERSDVSASRS